MILQALYQLAEREGLIEDPDFEPKPIHWIIRIGPGGKFLGFKDTAEIPPNVETIGKGKKKPKPVPRTYIVPRDAGMNTRTSGSYAGPLYDKLEYVFGAIADEKDRTEKNIKRAQARRDLFRERVRSVFDATDGDEGVGAVLAFLESVAAGKGPEPPVECGPGDLFAFIYNPDVDLLVTEREALKRWWRNQRSIAPETDKPLQCLVTGKPFTNPDLFPKIKRVPGVQGDISLVSFNKPAFESYGFGSNENAPVSREAAEAVATALNRLLHPAYPKPDGSGETLRPRSRRLSDDTALCYWAASADVGFLNALAALFDADPDIVNEQFKSIWRGVPPRKDDDMSPFYGLIITGTQGRAILRDWFETTLGKAQQSIAQHFADLRIVSNAPWKKGEARPPAIALGTLLSSIAEQGKQENIPATLAGQFVRAALTGTLYPMGLLVRAICRARAEIGSTDWMDLQRRDARAALIKAVLNRNYRRDAGNSPDHMLKEITEAMDPNNKNEGYILGCLMAVLERLQQEALGDVNASVVDKYFSGASAAPRATFDRLVRNARHHARKAADGDNPGLVFRLERLMDHFISRLNVKEERGKPIGFPLTLPLEQQGLFVIGYHHMRHWLFMGREEREAWESENPDAPQSMLWNRKNRAEAATAVR